MGLFEKIFRPARDKKAEKALKSAEGFFRTFSAYRPVFTSWQGSIYESMLVRAAIDARARHISKLKVELQGESQPNLRARMGLGPNPWHTWSQFLYRASTILDVHNTSFIVPVLDEKLCTIGVYPVLPSRCEILMYKNEPWLRYTFSHGEKAAVELSRCGVLTKFQYLDDFFGENNSAMNETMQLIHVQNKGIEAAAKNSAVYRFMARVSNFATEEDLANERKRFSRKNLASDVEDGGLLLFPNIYSDITQLKDSPYSPPEGQMKLIRENVYDYFGVNEKVLRNEASGDDLDAFFNGSIEPFAIQFSEVMTAALYTENERLAGNFVIANANRLQYMSTTAKVSMAQELGDRGALLIDEIRELFNYGPLPDGKGQRAPIRGEYHYSTDAEGGEPDGGQQ